MFKKILYFASVIVIFSSFNFRDNIPPSGWYQQFMPSLGNATLSDISFPDSLIGYASTTRDTNTHNSYILKTTNGGDNWFVSLTDNGNRNFVKIIFINKDTGFAAAKFSFKSNGTLYKTTNAGINWITIPNPLASFDYEDIAVINENILWCVEDDFFSGGAYLSTNGGLNWTRKFDGGNFNPVKIYMYNERIGFITRGTSSTSRFYKTTNSGDNWTLIPNTGGFDNLFFLDSLIGFKCQGFNLYKSSDGGLTWKDTIFKSFFSGGVAMGFRDFHAVNEDTIWGSGGYFFPGFKSIIPITTNGGNTWGYQIPHDSVTGEFSIITFYNKNYGWMFRRTKNDMTNSFNGVHTVTGGDTIIHLVDIKQISTEIPIKFKLYQNYPNPFNPKTKISFSVKSQETKIGIKIYDISGKFISELVNQNISAGTYEVEFDGSNLSSGIYFYSLISDNFTETKKMMLIK
ncbi:MAG TPA: T9SS type A sorting domain-containing protein [Ignavibacteria bacterium]|nr:T9SS type A sorting domain-containing protein [Ignavibacteria bacterium]